MWHLRDVRGPGAQVDHDRPGRGRSDGRQHSRYVGEVADDKTVRTEGSGDLGEVRPVEEREVVPDASIVELVELCAVTPVVTDDDDDRQIRADRRMQLS